MTNLLYAGAAVPSDTSYDRAAARPVTARPKFLELQLPALAYLGVTDTLALPRLLPMSDRGNLAQPAGLSGL
jgi:hypothetical protein